MFQVLPIHRFDPIGRCIYCGGAATSDEHIIPRALGGNLILPRASCQTCAKETSKIEQLSAWDMFGPYRIRMGIPGRRARKKPQYLLLETEDANGARTAVRVLARDHPSALAMLVWGRARLLVDDTTEENKAGVMIYFPDDATARMLSRPGVNALWFNFRRIRAFARMLAKIAYCTAIQRKYLPIDPHSYIVRCIMDDSFDYLPFIGGDIGQKTQVEGVLHQIRFATPTVGKVKYLVAEIQLFAHLGMPLYQVILDSHQAQLDTP